MRIFNGLLKVGASLGLCVVLSMGGNNARAEVASVQDDCGSLSMTSSVISLDGQYVVDVQGSIPSGFYYMAYVYQDDSTEYSDYFSSFFDNTLSTRLGPYSEEHLFKLVMRGGSTKQICAVSLELVVGGTANDPIEMSKNICSVITELDDTAFKNNPRQRKKALCNKLDEFSLFIKYAINVGDPGVRNLYYIDAIEKLTKDIGAKMDALFGGHKKNDWIVDPKAQSIVHPLVHGLIEALQAEM